MAGMIVGGLLDLGIAVVIGVDPGSRSTGVCLMRGDGRPRKSWSIRSNLETPQERLQVIHVGISRVFNLIKRAMPDQPIEVVIEESIFGGKDWTSGRRGNIAKVAGLHGEIRGLVLAEAWRRGWKTRKMVPVSWKAGMTKAEWKMKKGREYVAYWNTRLGWKAKSPDEIDACLIGIRGVRR